TRQLVFRRDLYAGTHLLTIIITSELLTSVPSLIYSEETVDTFSGPSTSYACSNSRGYDLPNECVIDDPQIVGRKLDCPFYFLGCTKQIATFDNWAMHCKYHFRTKLPKRLTCPFENCLWPVAAVTGEEAWEKLNEHIQKEEHQVHSKIDTKRRPNEDLIKHLWNCRIITSVEQKELTSYGTLERTTYVLTTGKGRNSNERIRR
ncbi:hypothetical protein K470DRAFT_261151, partial [Piedraia hortae CBS 480.64]